MLRTLWCSLTAIACAIPLAGQGLITSVAGTDWLFPANGKPARTAPLGRVTGVAFDRSGNLLVADPDNAQVFKIDANGTITIFAGNGISGFSGDNGHATAASLREPNSIAVDSSGNVCPRPSALPPDLVFDVAG